LGARKKRAPRRGSLGFSPRKRASRLVPRIKTWPQINSDKPLPLAFLAYKAGMTHAFIVDDRKGSPTYGQEIMMPVTIIETPPLVVLAVRGYSYDPNRGLFTLSEAWVEPPSELELYRKIPTLGAYTEHKLKILQDNLDKLREISIIVASQPKLVGGLSKKKPDLLEIKIGGGSIEERFDYAFNKLGKKLNINEIFKPGQLVDVIAVTKGKGFQGPVKRWGVKELPRWHKHRKGSRRVGSRSHGRGTWWEIPQAGQTGYHRRTEYNKRILAIGENGLEVTPAGGFLHYGIVRSEYAIIAGSIPGVPKRPIVLRHPVRPPRWFLKMESIEPPKITYLSLASKQGN